MVGFLVLLSTLDVRAASVIPPGREEVVLDLVRSAVAEAPPATLDNISVDGGVIAVRVSLDDGEAREFQLGPPNESIRPVAGRWMLLGNNVWLNCHDSCANEESAVWKRLADAFGRGAGTRMNAIWVPESEAISGRTSPPRTGGVRSVGSGRLRSSITEGVLVFATLWLLWAAAVGWRKKRFEWDWLAVFGLLSVFVTVALAVSNHGSVHEHNSFILRSDCAFLPDCDVDPRGPGWSPPVFHVYHVLFRLLPNLPVTTSLVSLGLTVTATILAYAFVRMLFGHFGRPRAGRIAAVWATMLFLLQPVVVRMAVADTFWPFVLVALWASGIALLWALRTGSFLAMLASAGWFGLAVVGNIVYLTIIPIAAVAILAWRREALRTPGWAGPTAVVAGLAFVSPYFIETFQATFLTGHQGADLFRTHFAPTLLTRAFVSGLLWLQPWLTPLAGVLLLVIIVMAATTSYRRMMLPLVAMYLLTEPLLSAMGSTSVWAAYPVRLVFALPGLQLLAVMGGCGVAWLEAHVRERTHLLQGALAGLILVSLPFCTEGWRFVTGETVFGRELAELSRAFEVLPEHDLLVIAPGIHPHISGTKGGSDPVEVYFPQGEYRYVFSRRGLAPAHVEYLDGFLAWVERTGVQDRQRVLFYLGSSLRTFLAVEIDSGVVPDSLEREVLTLLRERFLLEPVHLFELETSQHPGFSGRLLADRLPSAEFGFYWLRERDSD